MASGTNRALAKEKARRARIRARQARSQARASFKASNTWTVEHEDDDDDDVVDLYRKIKCATCQNDILRGERYNLAANAKRYHIGCEPIVTGVPAVPAVPQVNPRHNVLRASRNIRRRNATIDQAIDRLTNIDVNSPNYTNSAGFDVQHDGYVAGASAGRGRTDDIPNPFLGDLRSTRAEFLNPSLLGPRFGGISIAPTTSSRAAMNPFLRDFGPTSSRSRYEDDEDDEE